MVTYVFQIKGKNSEVWRKRGLIADVWKPVFTVRTPEHLGKDQLRRILVEKIKTSEADNGYYVVSPYFDRRFQQKIQIGETFVF